MLRLLVSLALSVAVFSAAEAAETQAADERTVSFIKSFVEIPVEQIPPDRVGDFMKVDLSGLPVKLREKALARKLELHVLKDLSARGRYGMLRTPEPKCPINDDAKTDDAKLLKAAGFTEITEDEETQVETLTNCGQRALMCEFSLQILLKKDKKGKPAGKRYFLHPNDPLMSLVNGYRNGSEPPSYKPSCSR